MSALLVYPPATIERFSSSLKYWYTGMCFIISFSFILYTSCSFDLWGAAFGTPPRALQMVFGRVVFCSSAAASGVPPVSGSAQTAFLIQTFSYLLSSVGEKSSQADV